MSRTIPRFASLTLALLACAGTAVAQQPAVGQTAGQATQPPVTERIEPGSDVPATTIEPRRGTQIIEKRGNDGNVSEIEVQSGKSNYIMRSGAPVGNAQPGDAQSSAIRAPQWKVLEFDLGPKKQAAPDDAAAAAAAPAGAATPAAAKAAPAGKVPPATVPMTKPADIPPPPPMPASGR